MNTQNRWTRVLSILVFSGAVFALFGATSPAQAYPLPQVVAPVAPATFTVPVQTPTSLEYRAAHSRASRDLVGSRPSLYRGKYFHADQESFRLCVAKREGEYRYSVRGGGGGNYFGTYQMSAALLRGVSWMMAAESRETHDGLRAKARALHSVPGNHWNRYWQDRAFATILNYNGKWSGKKHWSGGRWHC